MKAFKLIFIALVYMFPFLVYFWPELYLYLRIDPFVLEDLARYYFFVPFPFTVYALLGEFIKKRARKAWVLLSALAAPAASLVFAMFYFKLFGVGVDAFALGDVLILAAAAHFLAGIITAIVIIIH